MCTTHGGRALLSRTSSNSLPHTARPVSGEALLLADRPDGDLVLNVAVQKEENQLLR